MAGGAALVQVAAIDGLALLAIAHFARPCAIAGIIVFADPTVGVVVTFKHSVFFAIIDALDLAVLLCKLDAFLIPRVFAAPRPSHFATNAVVDIVVVAAAGIVAGLAGMCVAATDGFFGPVASRCFIPPIVGWVAAYPCLGVAIVLGAPIAVKALRVVALGVAFT